MDNLLQPSPVVTSMHSCPECGRNLVSKAIYCPHCLLSLVEPREEWFPLSGAGIDNPVLKHSLVPEHRIISEERVARLCEEYSIEPTDLPQIKGGDPAIQHLACNGGDVIEIIRDSRTTDTARNYRMVVSASGDINKDSTATALWRNPASPAESTYNRNDDLSNNQALHIIQNLRAHIPPSQPGTCRQIAIDRQEAIDLATDRVQRAEPYTFIEGELGYGKSFFLHWARDEVLQWSAVSLVDLDDETNFLNRDTLISALRSNLETPRSIAHEGYANGLDELWDTTLRNVADLCASYYERHGYELREERMQTSIELAARELLSDAEVPAPVVEEVAPTARNYFDKGPQSLSQALLEEVSAGRPMAVIGLMSSLARLNGYRVLLGVDELEKAARSEDHFDAITAFVRELPENVSLFVTGTPELVEGGEEGNAFSETHQPLYDKTVKNRISLKSPSKRDLIEFSERIVHLERQAITTDGDREYLTAIERIGGIEAGVDGFLREQSPAFRAYLNYLEQQ